MRQHDLKQAIWGLIALCMGLLLAYTTSYAQIPQTMSYQGVLTDASGAVVPDGNYNLSFKLYDVPTGGTHLWEEGQLVSVTKGIFNAILGSITPLALPFHKPYWLGVAVAGGPELTPRIPLTSSAYSFNALSVANNAVSSIKIADGTVEEMDLANRAVTPPKIAPGPVDGQVLTTSSGNVVWQTPPNGGGLTLPYSATVALSLPAFKVINTGTQSAIHAEGSGSQAIYAQANSVGGTGVNAHSDNGTGVLGYGIDGVSGTGTRTGVLGQSSGQNAQAGVWGASDNSVGFVGKSTGGDGVSGETAGSFKSGVYGYSSVVGGYGVYGRNGHYGSTAFLARENGVRGDLGNTVGILASGSVGAYGQNSVSGYWGALGRDDYAGFFVGPVYVGGTFTASGTKSFMIDHPLDPANRVLLHAAMESNEVLNQYSGNVVLDERGEAMVQLPEWFEAIDRDMRYQLTCIGGFAPVYIAEKITNNRFRIAGGLSGLEVSWQVTGVRNDPYMRQHPFEAERDKPASERGYFLQPEAYGQPEEKGIEWLRKLDTRQQPKPEPLKILSEN